MAKGRYVKARGSDSLCSHLKEKANLIMLYGKDGVFLFYKVGFCPALIDTRLTRTGHDWTLRLELAPLGVTVITGMLGSIESNFHVNDSWQGVPESSRYKSVEAQIANSAEGKVGPKKEKVRDFARRFIDDVLRGASGQIWRGAMAQTTRAIGHHAPMRVLVCNNILLG